MMFRAQYAGYCNSLNCPHDNRFREGDDVEHVGGSLMHTACARANQRETSIPLCGTCFTRHAPDRECY